MINCLVILRFVLRATALTGAVQTIWDQ